MPKEPLRYYPAANPVFCWAAGIFIALIGAGFVLSGFRQVNHSPVTGVGQALLGAAVLFVAWRMARYPARATFSLTDDALILRPMLWLTTTVRFAEITGFGLYSQHNQVKIITGTQVARATGRTVTSEHLVVILKTGGTRTVTLPGFSNEDLLAELTARTGLSIERMPDREAG